MYETYISYIHAALLFQGSVATPLKASSYGSLTCGGVFIFTFFFYDKAFYEQGLRGKTDLPARSSAPLGPPRADEDDSRRYSNDI